jgi:hypothetical protein
VLLPKRLRPHLTYANVMASVAVFVALGGSSYAALKITGGDVENGSLTYKDLERNTLGGARIKESQLGKVPRARNADRLGGFSAARLLVRCAPGTRPSAGVCVETAPRAPLPYDSAVLVCATADYPSTPGRRLPTHGELRSALTSDAITLASGGELTGHVYPSSTAPGGVDALYVSDELGHVALTGDSNAGRKAFRCVSNPLNR